MNQDPIWQAFAETGDPLYYLLYRAVEKLEKAEHCQGQTEFQTAAVET